ncbi:hypothetical protein [Desulfofalx alkaliphila]|uniref:hypothetical protein n=1 Tax=Desulfofalx alkaliphila TaxID=105483 RepID=UPI001A9A414B|nr:hypothetical protein [Desulfofalx alkaliphila]
MAVNLTIFFSEVFFQMASKKDLYALIDKLPDKEFLAAKRYLEFLLENAIKNNDAWEELLNNPNETSEPLTAQDKAAIREAEEDIKAGRVKPWEVVKKGLDRGV